MWKLLQESWFDKTDPRFRRQVGAVEVLQRCWREWLAAAMSHAKPLLTREEALAKLPTLDGTELLALDQSFRYHQWMDDERGASRGRVAPTEIRENRQEAEAY